MERGARNQLLYNLGERSVEAHEEPALAADGAALVAYTPFGRGAAEKSHSGVAVLERIARDRDVSASAVILAFLTRESNAFAIPKAASVEHVEDNARAGALELDPTDIDAIAAAYPMRARRGGLPTL
jgi:diketogulonate reductase-like aldo/keto reductase